MIKVQRTAMALRPQGILWFMSLGMAARAAFWIAAVAIAFLVPLAGESLFRKVEKRLAGFASRRLLCCFALGLLVLVTRLTMLPLREIPRPYIADEFGYLLQADTFSSLRLTNPPHPMAGFFENPYVLQHPTYTAKFPPGQGLMLAIGQLLTGDPWFGVWLSCGLLAGVLCWSLQGWFSPGWALLGAILTLPLCISTYWMDSYWGGAVAAIGGALVIGALPRLRRSWSAAAMLGLGSVVLLCTRPFEGSLVLGPIFLYLATQGLPLRTWAMAFTVMLAGAGWLGYYNYRVTGNPARLPYVEYDRQHPSTSHFNILPLPPR